MTRQNCWDFHQCGREVGGSNTASLGVCAAATDHSANGLNSGMNAGRLCWAVSGTLCGGQVQGTHAEKRASCLACAFFKTVQAEEDAGSFNVMKPGQSYVRHS